MNDCKSRRGSPLPATDEGTASDQINGKDVFTLGAKDESTFRDEAPDL